MPYQTTGVRRSNVQLGVGRSLWIGSVKSLIPERVFDGIPGFLAWCSVIFVLVAAFTAPWIVFSLAVLIGSYMAIRMCLGAIANIYGLRNIREWEARDWAAYYQQHCTPDSLPIDQVLHVICIPNYKEELSILQNTLRRLASNSFAKQQMCVVLAMEAGEGDSGTKAERLRQEFQEHFRHILITIHPKGLSGELQGKSANESWAVRNAKRQLVDEMGYSLDSLIITISDADSLLHPKYLEALGVLFALAPDRHATIWQAPIRYHSNIWNIHPALSVVQAYSVAWELAYLTAPWWHPVPISTYSLSLRLADDVGYWDTDVIAEDLHMFLKSFFHRGSHLRLGRIFLPFSGSSVPGITLVEACKNRYAQTLRHAWGAKEIGYTLSQMVEHPEASLVRSVQVLFRVAHDIIMAGAGWIILTFGQIMPMLINPTMAAELRTSPHFWILQGSYIIVAVVSIFLWWVDLHLRPPRPHPWTAREIILTILSFALMPFLTVIFVALPVMQAQTQLLFGVPLQYQVAKKI